MISAHTLHTIYARNAHLVIGLEYFENIIKIAFYIGLFMGINLILKQDNISKKNKEIGQNILDIYQFHTFSNIYQYISDKELEKIETTLPEEYGDKFINTFNKIIKKFR